VDATAEQTKRLSARYPVEDVTGRYTIRSDGGTIDTSRPRVVEAGNVRTHPSYKSAPALPPGPHHYLVQFVGPIKPEWLDEVRKAGGELRRPYAVSKRRRNSVVKSRPAAIESRSSYAASQTSLAKRLAQPET